MTAPLIIDLRPNSEERPTKFPEDQQETIRGKKNIDYRKHKVF
jgi:hypothetical protein